MALLTGVSGEPIGAPLLASISVIVRQGEPMRRRVLEAASRLDSDPRLLAAVEWTRSWLPGDPFYGDPLSTGDDAVGRVAAQLAPLAATRPSVLREVGLTALQLWQAHAGVEERPDGDDVVVLFTDLAGFSDWTLEVGDDLAVTALRRVGAAVEPLVRRRGRVVKRLGDGLMAVHPTVQDAVEVALAARDAVEELDVDGHRLHLRAGVHVGRPQQLGGDYYGRDVNIAARITDAAGAGEVCVSSPTRALLDGSYATFPLSRRRGKGVPPDITPWRVGRRKPGGFLAERVRPHPAGGVEPPEDGGGDARQGLDAVAVQRVEDEPADLGGVAGSGRAHLLHAGVGEPRDGDPAALRRGLADHPALLLEPRDHVREARERRVDRGGQRAHR